MKVITHFSPEEKATLKSIFDNLENEFKELLVDIKNSQKEGFYDPRGYYAEFDSWDCKPYTHSVIIEAQSFNWLEIHPDSDTAHFVSQCDYDYDFLQEKDLDASSGVCLVSIKDEYLDIIPDSL